MQSKESVEPTLETLTAIFRRYKLMLADPGASSARLLAALIAEPPCPLYYHDFAPQAMGVDTFLTSLMLDLAQQNPAFGYHLGQTLQDSPGQVDLLAESLAADLDRLEREDYLLILDDFDRADEMPDVRMLVEQLLERLPGQCHLLLLSRTTPPLPWLALTARNEAAVLPRGA